MLKIGLTGGIAAGKTSVAQWFKDKQIPVFDADQTVHELYSDPEVTEVVRKVFGWEYIQDNRVDRILLGRRVFQDPQARAKLEEIIHPLVLQKMQDKCAQAEAAGEKVIILDVPLLLEAGWEKVADLVWVVYTPVSVQLQRLMHRNELSEAEARERVATQIPLEVKVRMADTVIDNSGSWTETEEQLRDIWEELLKKMC